MKVVGIMKCKSQKVSEGRIDDAIISHYPGEDTFQDPQWMTKTQIVLNPII
jgi:hypothetical protein